MEHQASGCLPKEITQNIASKFAITELLLSGQARQNFLQVKTEICDSQMTDTSMVIVSKHVHSGETFKDTIVSILLLELIICMVPMCARCIIEKGDKLTPNTIHLASLAECTGHFGMQNKTKMVDEKVLSVVKKKTATGRNSCYISGQIDLGARMLKVAHNNVESIWLVGLYDKSQAMGSRII